MFQRLKLNDCFLYKHIFYNKNHPSFGRAIAFIHLDNAKVHNLNFEFFHVHYQKIAALCRAVDA